MKIVECVECAMCFHIYQKWHECWFALKFSYKLFLYICSRWKRKTFSNAHTHTHIRSMKTEIVQMEYGNHFPLVLFSVSLSMSRRNSIPQYGKHDVRTCVCPFVKRLVKWKFELDSFTVAITPTKCCCFFGSMVINSLDRTVKMSMPCRF